MSKNVEINIANSSGRYEVLYPKTDYNLLLNKLELPLSIINGGTGVSSLNSFKSSLHSYAYQITTTYTGNGSSNGVTVYPRLSIAMYPNIIHISSRDNNISYNGLSNYRAIGFSIGIASRFDFNGFCALLDADNFSDKISTKPYFFNLYYDTIDIINSNTTNMGIVIKNSFFNNSNTDYNLNLIGYTI